MTDQILITLAGAALNGPAIPQLWRCENCGATMDIVDGLAHILYDCPADPATAEYRHVKEQWANRPEASNEPTNDG